MAAAEIDALEGEWAAAVEAITAGKGVSGTDLGAAADLLRSAAWGVGALNKRGMRDVAMGSARRLRATLLQTCAGTVHTLRNQLGRPGSHANESRSLLAGQAVALRALTSEGAQLSRSSLRNATRFLVDISAGYVAVENASSEKDNIEMQGKETTQV